MFIHPLVRKTVIRQRISKLIGMYPLGTINISTNCYVMLQVDVELLLLTQKNVSSPGEKRLIVSAVVQISSQRNVAAREASAQPNSSCFGIPTAV